MTTADPIAELIAMRAKGEINDVEFQLAKKHLTGETPKMSPASPETVTSSDTRATGQTTTKRGGGGRHGMLLWFYGLLTLVGCALVGVLIPPVIYLGLVIFCGLGIYGVVVMFVGVKDFYRVGACPNCQTPITSYNRDGSSTKCSGCKRPMILRDTKLHDVS